MSRGRILIALGGLASLCASAGLLVFGTSVISVLDVFTWHLGEPAPEALGGLAWAAMCAVLFAAGVGLACTGQAAAARTQAATIAGRLLLGLAGAGSVCAALAIMCGAWGARSTFHTIATSATVPRPAMVVEAVSLAVVPVTIGLAVLLLAQVLLIAGGVFGFKGDCRRGGSSAGVAVVAGGVAVFGLLLALLFVANWWLHGRAIEAVMVAGNQMPKPAELGGHMSAVLRNALVAALCLAIGGLLQGMVAVLLPGKARS